MIHLLRWPTRPTVNFRSRLLPVLFWLICSLLVCAHHFTLSGELTIPSLVRHIPEWFPGAGWKKTAKEWSETVTEVSNRPHNHVKQQLVKIHVLDMIHFTINSDLNPSCWTGRRNSFGIFLLYFT